MFINKINKSVRLWLLPASLLLSACGDISNDLLPSGTDARSAVIRDTPGGEVGQILEDFSLLTTEGNVLSNATLLAAGQPLVLYFTMWCPICDAHMSDYKAQIAPDFPDVHLVLVDFVSGDIEYAYSSQISAGYRNETVIVDDGTLESALYGSMGTTVVVDLDGVIRMNEDYKTGSRLRSVLEALQK